MNASTRQPAGMRAFVVVWIGQMVSLLGSGLTAFGVTIWAFEQTGRATDLALLGFFFLTPMLIVSPIAGVFVDRYNRKFMMMISDLMAGLTTIAVLILLSSGHLQIWHLFITNAVNGAFQSFQWPAFSAAISLMLDKANYTRANSMMHLADSASGVVAPLLAGSLIGPIGLTGLLTIDIVTFVFAVGTLFFVHIPETGQADRDKASQGSFFKDVTFGFRYILDKRPLLGIQLVFMTGNFFFTLAFAVEAAMILASTGNNEFAYGLVQTIGAVGGVLGGIVISAWGGFKRNINGVLLGWAFAGLTLILMAFGRPDPLWHGVLLWGGGLFAGAIVETLINGSNQSIWQSKVAPELQGRVFSIRLLIAWLVQPLARLLAGPLADRVFEPALKPGGVWFYTVGSLLRQGPGAGMSLMFLICGVLITLTGLGGYLVPVIRHVEDLLPDHEAAGEVPAPDVDGDPVPEAV